LPALRLLRLCYVDTEETRMKAMTVALLLIVFGAAASAQHLPPAHLHSAAAQNSPIHRIADPAITGFSCYCSCCEGSIDRYGFCTADFNYFGTTLVDIAQCTPDLARSAAYCINACIANASASCAPELMGGSCANDAVRDGKRSLGRRTPIQAAPPARAPRGSKVSITPSSPTLPPAHTPARTHPD
jgi:hypothetical protein